MTTKWASILMALLGISAIILPAIADCGCEDEVYMRVTYIERHTGIKKTVYTASRGWWPINYRADSYSPRAKREQNGVSSRIVACAKNYVRLELIHAGRGAQIVGGQLDDELIENPSIVHTYLLIFCK